MVRGKIVFAFLVILMLFVSTPGVVAPPMPPCIFYGYVSVGGSPAPDGLNVTAVIRGTTLNWTTETGGGTYGWGVKGSSNFYIPSYNSDAPVKDGGATGDIIEFYLEGIKTNQIARFTSGGGREMETDLSITNIPGLKSYAALTVSLDCSSAYVGYNVKVSGRLAYANGTGISSANLLLNYWTTGGASWTNISSIATTIAGDYYAEWMPNATGSYLIKASWEGNQTLNVLGAEADIGLAVTSQEAKYAFSVVSNSTISELAYNSTTRSLGFNVTGPSGTTGYANITIAKDLVGKITELNVHLDENIVYYSATSTDVSWLLHFTYQHSTHKVAVELGSLAGPFFENLLIITAIFVVIVIASVMVYKVRGRLRHPHNKPKKQP